MHSSEFLNLMATLAPLELAASWDNVGVIVDAAEERDVRRVLLTIDMTEHVLAEALDFGAEAIIAYHPPIFSGLKRLERTTAAGRLHLALIRSGILVYSPHTALDACRGGLNDWLAGLLPKSLARPLDPLPAQPELGQGRFLELQTPHSLDALITLLKSQLHLDYLRVARAARHSSASSTPSRPATPNAANELIATVALCPGAGGSVLANTNADLLLTGEMRHHDVLAHQRAGRSVLLTEHTGTERGYLPVLAARLETLGLLCRVSRSDREPLELA